MRNQKSSNDQKKDVPYYRLAIIGALCGFIGVVAFVAVAWLILSRNPAYFNNLALLTLSVFWLFKYRPGWCPRFSYLMVAAGFSIIGAALLCAAFNGGGKWFETGNIEEVGVPWPIALLAAIAELIPAILWFISLCKCDWEKRGIDKWISKMSIYSILWVFLLFLSEVNKTTMDTTTKSATSSSVDNFMWTCFTSFLIIGSLKESIKALVTLRITDNDLV